MSQTQVTALAYVAQTGAFKAVDIYGKTNLDPETATTFNVGVISDFGTDNWTMTLDYYDFVIDNPIQNQNYAQLAAAYEAGGAAKAAIQSQIYGGTNLTNDGSFTAAQIGRIRSNFVNGAEVQTNGLDLFVKYETDYADGVLTAGMEANWILKYSTRCYNIGAVQIAGAYDCDGFQYQQLLSIYARTKSESFLITLLINIMFMEQLITSMHMTTEGTGTEFKRILL